MSKASKAAFISACVFTVGSMAYVHYRQFEDRYLLHQGVVRDTETQHRRQMANQHSLQTQIDITRRLKDQQQKVQDGTKDSI
ncbi:unnamed protein product [Allacma fusca]|uniref:Uncharacterized protein n=1 Tax=Allacma fusca TaxID=39272 RepID=A0A8J2J6P2_9HEXA|nr:unnamed protein product [Allacma fusca]